MNYFEHINKTRKWVKNTSHENSINGKQKKNAKNRKTAKGYLITESTLKCSFPSLSPSLHPRTLQNYLVLLSNNFSTCQFPLIRFSICAKKHETSKVVFLIVFLQQTKVFPSLFFLLSAAKCGKRQQQKH